MSSGYGGVAQAMADVPDAFERERERVRVCMEGEGMEEAFSRARISNRKDFFKKRISLDHHAVPGCAGPRGGLANGNGYEALTKLASKAAIRISNTRDFGTCSYKAYHIWSMGIFGCKPH